MNPAFRNPFQLTSVIKTSFFRIFLFVFLLISKNTLAQHPDVRFNVLFIVLDDMNEKCSVLGYPQVLTPNLQRLAAHGMVFTNAYCQFSLCNPSRTSILTGWRPDKTRVFNNETSPRSKIGQNVRLMPEYFHDYGYRTERYGKIMHSEFESECTWDYPAITNKFSTENNFTAYKISEEETKPGQWWVTLTKDSLKTDARFCTKLDSSLRTKKTQPFFYGLGLQGPHAPFTPGLTSWNLYGDSANKELMQLDSSGRKGKTMGNGSATIALPNTPPNDLADIPGLESQGAILREPDDEWRRSVHAYYAEVTEMDTQLGRVLDELDNQKLWSSTIVVFISDHGQFLGEHEGMWFKNRLLDEALHVPMIICAPGMPPGRCNRLVELVDIYPTLTDLCGLKRPSAAQGISLVPLLVNPQFKWKPSVFSQVTRGTSFQLRSLYTDKYHYNKLGTSYELYDRINDPLEYTNLALDTLTYAHQLDSLQTILDSGWKKSFPPTKDSFIYFIDKDNDGYGSLSAYIFGDSTMPASYVKNAIDCNDNNPAFHPGAPELCDGVDYNCDGIVSLETIISPVGPLFICNGDSVKLTSIGDSCGYYQWLKNGVPVASGGKSKTYFAKETGNYSFRRYDGYGISDTSDTDSVTVKFPPAANVTVSQNTNVCMGQVVLTAAAGDGFTYQWVRNNVDIKTDGMSQIFYPKSGGNYRVKITSKYGCTGTSGLTKVTNICEKNLAGIKSVYPNPVKNTLNISYNSAGTSNLFIIIKDMAGIGVKTCIFNVTPGDNGLSIDISGIKPGNYLIEAVDKSSISNKQIVIVK